MSTARNERFGSRRGPLSCAGRLGLLLAALQLGESPASTELRAAQTGPLQVWEIDFDDPTEAGRWRDRTEGATGLLDWRTVPRDTGNPASPRVLQIFANSGPNVENIIAVCQDFPHGFSIEIDAAMVLEWEWKIADTEVSDTVGLGILREGDPPVVYPSVDSHTRYTLGWHVLFDPADRWTAHRIAIGGPLWPPTWGPRRTAVGLCVVFTDPVKQRVHISRLRVEKWPLGALESDPLFGPHRPAPPPRPFEKVPLAALRRATAAAAEDLDGDGMPELLVIERRGYAHLYRNDGRGGFLEEADAGIADALLPAGALFVDVDADGDADLVLTGEFDTPRFYENTGGLRFRERPVLGDAHLDFWYGAAADDLDGDGDADFTLVAIFDQFLYLRNDGGWRLTPSTLVPEAALRPLWDILYLFSAALADADRDGLPDLLLSGELFFPSRSGWALREDAWADPVREKVEGSVFEDFTSDGIVDVLVLRDTAETGHASRLLLGRGDGTFDEAAGALPDLESAEVALAEDFDNDGAVDVYVCQRGRSNVLLLSDGLGGFRDATRGSGLEDTGGCDGAVAADLDGDGGMDVVVVRYGQPPAILFNRLERGRWLGVAVQGKRTPIGAEVTAIDRASGRPVQTRWVRAGRGFGSTGPAELRLGIGDRAEVDLEVRFPDGHTRRLERARGGSSVLVRREGGGVIETALRLAREAVFPGVRSFRRAWSRRPWLAPVLAAVAFGLALASHRLPRTIQIPVLVAGGLLALAPGSTPGRGVAGSPPVLWALGTVAGVAAWPVGRGVIRAARRRRARLEAPGASLEGLARRTQDFRHAGLETRTLLSIHNRVQNLFLDGVVHEPFLAALPELARRYAGDTAPRLRALVEAIAEIFPDLGEARSIIALVDRLDRLLSSVPAAAGAAARPGPLSEWRTSTLTELEALEERLAGLLDEVDRRCECDVAAVLEEARSMHDEEMRERGISVDLRCDLSANHSRAVIPRPELLMILENLFTNAASAMDASADQRIVIAARWDGARVIVDFRDTGRGVPPEQEARIFQYGFSDRAGGKGYGLARSREILGHFGGSIRQIPPEEGPGARFRIALRVVPGADPTRGPS